MKAKLILAAVLIGAIQLFSAWELSAADPVVSNVVAAQKTGTKQVEISYDLADADSTKLTVQIWVSADGGNTWYVHADSCVGDIGYGIAPGTGKKITWDAGQDFAGFSSSNMKVKVVAIDAPPPPAGEYVYVDVSSGYNGAWQVVELSELPSDLQTNDVWKTDRILLRRIPAGTFTMGSPDSEFGHESDETQHTVTLTTPFYIGVFEVTQKQYETVMGTTPSYFGGNPKRPVETVSWDMIRSGSWPNGNPAPETFTGRLRQKLAGQPFDLPTESQWEYACRAGTIRAYNDQTKNGGEGSDCTTLDVAEDPNLTPLAWYRFNSSGATHDVGGKQANAFGLYDMHGNVWEWCLDYYGTYPVDPTEDPAGALTGSNRVIRGGYCYDDARYCRSAYRYNGNPSYTDSRLGFRLCLPLVVQ